MDRERAIQILKRCEAESYCSHYKRHYCCIGCGQREALDLAIEALGQTEIDDCDNFYKGYCSVYEDGCFHQCEKDCISRADAIAYIDRIINSGLGRNKSLDYIRKYIYALPPVTPIVSTDRKDKTK